MAVYFAFTRRLFQWQCLFVQLSSQDCSSECCWRHFPGGCWLTGLLAIMVTTYDMDVDRLTHIWVYDSICCQLLTQCVLIVCGCGSNCLWLWLLCGSKKATRYVVSYKWSYYLKVWLIKLTFLWANNDTLWIEVVGEARLKFQLNHNSVLSLGSHIYPLEFTICVNIQQYILYWIYTYKWYNLVCFTHTITDLLV